MVPSWADQLLPQLLMEQFETLPIQFKHIEHMHEGVLFRKNNFWQNDSCENLDNFSLIRLLYMHRWCLHGLINSYYSFWWNNLILCGYNADTLNICMKEFGSQKIILTKWQLWELRQLFPYMAFVYAWIVRLWADQLLLQLLMEQFDTLRIQCRHIEHMHEGVYNFCLHRFYWNQPGRVAQSVTCLVTDAKLTADPGVASSIPARSHTFVGIDHEIISTVILLPSTESFMKGCCQLQANVCARLLVNCLFKLAQEKSVVRWTDRPAMTLAVDLGCKATKQTNKQIYWNLLIKTKVFLFEL